MTDPYASGSRIVALGGGHGLYATLSAARRLTPHITAVVTVADDGGGADPSGGRPVLWIRPRDERLR